MEKLVAELPSGTEKSVRFHRDLLKELTSIDMLVASKCHRVNLVAGTSAYVVDQVHVGVLILGIRSYFRIEVALALEEINQISPTLLHQIGINSALGEYRDEFFHLPFTKEWKP